MRMTAGRDAGSIEDDAAVGAMRHGAWVCNECGSHVADLVAEGSRLVAFEPRAPVCHYGALEARYA